MGFSFLFRLVERWGGGGGGGGKPGKGGGGETGKGRSDIECG